MKPFEHINSEAHAHRRRGQGRHRRRATEMTPSDMVRLTVRCRSSCSIASCMSNIANRTSDGLQQLFRQQS